MRVILVLLVSFAPALVGADFIPVSDAGRLREAMASLQVLDAPDDYPLAGKTRQLAAEVCMALADGSSHLVRRAEMDKMGVVGRIRSEKAAYYDRKMIEATLGGSSWAAIDPAQSFIRLLPPDLAAAEYPNYWSVYLKLPHRPPDEQISMVSILSIFARDVQGQEYPVITGLFETDQNESVLYGICTLMPREGHRFRVSREAVPPEMLLRAPGPLVGDPLPNRPVGAETAPKGQFAAQERTGAWVWKAGIALFVFGLIVAIVKLKGR